MRVLLPLLLLLHCSLSLAWTEGRYFELSVADSKGTPISAASVASGPYPWPQTDRDGRVRVLRNTDKVIVRKPGYKSAVLRLKNPTIATIPVIVPVVLQQGSHATACPPSTEFKGGQLGKLALPDMSQLLDLHGAQVSGFRTWKYTYVGGGPMAWFMRLLANLFEGPGIDHSMGPGWSDGFPVSWDVDDSTDYSEELIALGAQSSYTDARGTRSDGIIWRFIGTESETLSYEVESRSEAASLNRILDTVCVRPGLIP